MILVENIEASKFHALVTELFRETDGYEVHLLSDKFPNILGQGYGMSKDKESVIFEVKDPNLSEHFILSEAPEASKRVLGEWLHLKKLYVFFQQKLKQSIREEFRNRLGNNKSNVKIEIFDLTDLQREVNKNITALRKYENAFNHWYEVYDHIAFFLHNHFKKNQDGWAQLFFKEISESTFIRENSSSFFQYSPSENEFGIDPIQIFASFNYTGINKNKRKEIINRLLIALGSIGTVDDSISFEGIPTPIIRSIKKNRKIEAQNEIWSFFARIYSNGIQGLTDNDFKALKNWKGIQIPSLTMFLFWINSENFLPLDKNTVDYLKTLGLINERPKNYREYVELCEKKEKLKGSIANNDKSNIFRNIVKEAYSTFEKRNLTVAISGSTQTLIYQETGKKENKLEIESRLIANRKEQFKNFKIIAVRPKESVNSSKDSKWEKHLKNLHKGTVYCLYNAYKFNYKDDSVIDYDPNRDLEIYNHGDLNISISAIVGMNGSGKSAIADIIYLVINRIAYERKLLSAKKMPAEEVYADLFIKSDKVYKISVGEKVEVFIYEPDPTNSKYIKVTNDSKGINTFRKFDLVSLCYTLVVNYSLYGLNSEITGPWIYPLFEKNDSYQVPIVLNPKREQGKIDINRENDLAKSRLLMNLLEPKLINFDKGEVPRLTPDAVPEYLKFELDEQKMDRKRKAYAKVTNEKNINIVFEALNFQDIESVEYINEAKEYIYYKLISIAHNYPKYKQFRKIYEWIDDREKLNEYLKKLLSEETSHISFKLRQAVNYIAFNIYNSKSDKSVLSISMRIGQIIDEDIDEELRTIDLIPPSFLKTNVYFVHGGNFDALSSGEKQQIYSINTIAYHLFNLKSVMLYENTYKYSSINIIFDEVELYFHPDLQRTYIRNLRDRIISLNLNDDQDINNINIIFITHSPFILSDIPGDNVLMLKVDPISKLSLPFYNGEESFGANVHDLLANEFFMKDGFVGEFARQKIIKLIEFYHGKNQDYTEASSKKLISLIGDPLVSARLLDMHNERFGSNKDLVDLDYENWLQSEVERIKLLK